MLKAGDKAPGFKLNNQEGEEVSLSDFAGKTVVLYFYPRDNTPGCTREACAFKDSFAGFKTKNAVVIGVSADSAESHAKFAAKYELPFILLSDPDKSVMQAYGAYGEKVMYGKKVMGTIRSTFLIGPDGMLRKVWPKVSPDTHPAQVLAEL